MHIENMCKAVETMATEINTQLANGSGGYCPNDIPDIADVLKDLSEAVYYSTIVKEMKEAKEEEETLRKNGIDTSMIASRYYNDYRYTNGQYAPSQMGESTYMDYRRGYTMPYYPDDYDPANSFYMNKWRLGDKARYYDGNGSNGNGMSSTGGMSNYGGTRGYDYGTGIAPQYNESRLDKARRYYTETKMNHNSNSQDDKNAKLQSLEEYSKELVSDITDLIKDASPEEKAAMKTRLATLASKI